MNKGYAFWSNLRAEDLEQWTSRLSFATVYLAGLALLLLIGIAVLFNRRLPDGVKSALFVSIAFITLAASSLLIGSTIYLNLNSLSKGPVHWHADFEIWNCGRQLELQDPKGRLSNKIGTASLHEHNDGRIHLEGVVVKEHDASLGKFFRVVGGELTAENLSFPTNEGMELLAPGGACSPDEPASPVLQVFVYHTHADKTFSQQKLTDPAAYVISAESQIPPGDCVIIEFDQPRDRTDKLCDQYQYALDRGDLRGER